MPVGYHPRIHAERCQIHALLHRGWSKREMARDLGRDPATISRETSRHRGLRGYRHQPADRQATARRQEASAVPRKRTPERWAVAEERLQEGGSPEQIAGWVRLPGEGMAGQEWIYPQVRADRQAGGTRYRHRRRRGQKPNWRGGGGGGGGASCRTRSHSRSGRPCGAAGSGRREVSDWGLGTGSSKRSLARGTGTPWCRRWTGARSSCSWSGWTGRPRLR